MSTRYFLANASSNLAQFVSLIFLSLVMPHAEFGLVREFFALFLVVATLSQLGLSTSLITSWNQIENKFEMSVLISMCVALASWIFSFIYFDSVSLYLVTLSVILYSAPLVAAAVLQASSSHNRLLFFQNYPKILFYLTLMSMAVLRDIDFFLKIHIGLSIVIVAFLFSRMPKPSISYRKTRLEGDVVFVMSRSLVPFVLAASSTLLQNFEFILLPDDIDENELGSFAKASLIFSGSVAMLFFLQNRALSSLTAGELSRHGIARYSAKIFLISSLIAMLTISIVNFSQQFSSYLYFDYNPYIFYLVLFKLIVWSTYAVPGILVYHLGYGFTSLSLALFPILIATLIGYFDLVLSIEALLISSALLMAFSSVIVNIVVFRLAFAKGKLSGN